MKIAVIGSGISGLLSAWLLSRHHDVTVFEAQGHVGGHTHTHDIDVGGSAYAVDTGFIVYNERTYPGFIRLLEQLGVGSRVTDMSFSSSNERTGIEYSGTSLNTLLADRRNLLRADWWRLIADIVRFNRQARAWARRAAAVTAAELDAAPARGACPGATPAADDPTSVEARVARGWHGVDVELALGEFLERHRYSRSFVENYVLGMGAAIWSKPVAEVLRFPARAFIDFFANHGLLDFFDRPLWRVVQGGSRSYVERMLPDLAGRVHTDTPVRAVRRTDPGVQLDLDAQARVPFDQVVIACHSDQALALLEDPSPQEREVLGAIRYQPNDVVLHTDERLLPRSRRAWAAWNYRVPAAPEAPVAVTYNMNLLQHIDAPVTFCVTLNQSDAVAPDRVLERLAYAHPVFDAGALRAQRRRDEISGVRDTWYAGAYWRHGFHEDGLQSALDITRAFGVAL